MPVRVRFAPSPTGSLHLGSALVALLNWLFARRHGGSVLLRIDDTDAARSRPGLEQGILADLEWLGLDWDEGPLRQSERLERYREAADGLPGSYLRDGATYLRTPATVAVADLLRGQLRASASDFVLLRSDGRATYNWATVVDDLDHRITHVIRGEDHLANTALQLAGFAALGAEPPAYLHAGLLLGQEGKLSKRSGAASVADLRTAGYPAEAVVAYLGLVASSGPGEPLDLPGLVERFDASHIARGGIALDEARLRALSTRVIAGLPAAELAARVLALEPAAAGADQVQALVPALRGAHTLREAAGLVEAVVGEPARTPLPELAQARAAYPERLLGEERARELVAELRRRGVPLRRARLSLTGRDSGPELWAVLAAIPRDDAIRRSA